MNRYTARGLLDAAATDHTVILLLTVHQLAAHQALHDFEPLMSTGMTARHANGAEEIRCPGGGRIIIRSQRARLTYSADVVYLDTGVDQELSMDSLNAVLASTGGTVIRA